MAESAGKVLVTDDDPSILRLVTAVLKRAHYDVDTAKNGREALEKLAETHYDVAVLDLMMPEVSGLEVLERLTIRDPHPRFVVIMSAASPGLLHSAAGPHVFATLRKPFDVREMVDTVRACVGTAA